MCQAVADTGDRECRGPVGVLVLVVTDRLDDAKLPLEPLGNPLTLRVTWPLKPPVGLIVTL